MVPVGAGVPAAHGADHIDVAVGEVDEAEHTVDHGVSDGNEGEDSAPGETVDELLEELLHWLTINRLVVLVTVILMYSEESFASLRMTQ